MKVYEKIKYARDTLGLNRSEMAALLGVTDQSVRIWETESGCGALKLKHIETLYSCGLDLFADLILRDGWTQDRCRETARRKMGEYDEKQKV
jgi:DNA-binding XRE family transcriptional regulator